MSIYPNDHDLRDFRFPPSVSSPSRKCSVSTSPTTPPRDRKRSTNDMYEDEYNGSSSPELSIDSPLRNASPGPVNPQSRRYKIFKFPKCLSCIPGCLSCIPGCLSCIPGCFRKSISINRHRLTQYDDIYRYVPVLLFLIFFLMDVPFFVKNVVYYRSSITVDVLPLLIFDGLLRLFSLPFGITVYLLSLCCVKSLRKRKSGLLTLVVLCVVLGNGLAIGMRGGINQSLTRRIFDFDPEDPFQSSGKIEIMFIVFMILPLNAFWSFTTMFLASFILIANNVNDENQLFCQYVRIGLELLLIPFVKHYEDVSYQKDKKYCDNLTQIQDRVISEKKRSLETLREIVPGIRLFLLFQHSGQGKILLHHVYVVQARILKDNIFGQQNELNNTSQLYINNNIRSMSQKEKTLEYYRNYLLCSDHYDSIAGRYQMFRIHEEKERLMYISYTQRFSEHNVLFACSASLEMKEMYNSTSKIFSSFDMTFQVVTGSLSMGIDTINDRKIRFLMAGHSMRHLLGKLETHPISEIGEVYSIQEMVETSVTDIISLENYPDQKLRIRDPENDYSFPVCRLVGFLNRVKIYEMMGEGNSIRRNSIDLIRVKSKRDSIDTIRVDGNDDDDKNFKNANHNKIVTDVREEEDRTLFKQYKMTKKFKKKSLERTYLTWFRVRSWNTSRIMVNLFLSFLVKCLVVIGLLADNHLGTSLLVVHSQIIILVVLLILVAKIVHDRSGDIRRKKYEYEHQQHQQQKEKKKRNSNSNQKRKKYLSERKASTISMTSSVSSHGSSIARKRFRQLQQQRRRKRRKRRNFLKVCCPLCYCYDNLSTLNFYVVFLIFDCLFGFSWFIGHFQNSNHADDGIFSQPISYVNIDFYFNCFLIMQMFPVVPLSIQFFFAILRFVIWVAVRQSLLIHLWAEGTPEFSIFFFLATFPTIVFVLVVTCQRLTILRASRGIFKYSYRVQKMIRYLMNSRSFNRMILVNSIPTYHKIQKFIEDNEEEEEEESDDDDNNTVRRNSTTSTYASSRRSSSSSRKRIKSALPLFFNQCNIMMVHFEWINEYYGGEDEQLLSQKLCKLALLNEHLENLIDEKKKSGNGMERLQFSEKHCMVTQYNSSDLSNLLLLALEIRNSIMLFPDLYVRICVTNDKHPSFGKFMGGQRSDLFSESGTRLRKFMEEQTNFFFRNRVILLLLSSPNSNGRVVDKMRRLFKINSYFVEDSENMNVVEILHEQKKRKDNIKKRVRRRSTSIGVGRGSDKKKENIDHLLGNKKRKKFFNLKINDFLPHQK